MKKILLTLLAFSCFIAANYAVNKQNWKMKLQTEVEGITPDMTMGAGLDDFLALTPAKYKEMTGKKLGLVKTLQLKRAQKFLKKNLAGNEDGSGGDVPEWLYIVGAILGFAWLLIGIMDGWEGKNWWVNLILTILCCLPGLIHALVKKNEYY